MYLITGWSTLGVSLHGDTPRVDTIFSLFGTRHCRIHTIPALLHYSMSCITQDPARQDLADALSRMKLSHFHLVETKCS
jgi:hypothetical protein